MKKTLMIVTCIFVIIFAIFLGIKLFYKNGHVQEDKVSQIDEVEDECTDEWKYMNNDEENEVIDVSAGNEKVLDEEDNDDGIEHFILKDENGVIVVYINDGEEKLYEKTEISTEYLPETDKIRFQDGLDAFGKEELNKLLEDFE
jgi:uncharacterized protein YpmB